MNTARIPGPGANLARLRKIAGMTQSRLAQAMGVSEEHLGKMERGLRTLTQGNAARAAQALGTPLDEVLGRTPVDVRTEADLGELRAVIRRFDLPGERPRVDFRGILTRTKRIGGHVKSADLAALIDELPEFLTIATDHAHATGKPAAWEVVTLGYSAVYYLAARHRWMDLAELAVVRQKAAAERATPFAPVIAARDEAGAFLNSGDFPGGLAVVDRALVRAQAELSGRERTLAEGVLRLRGMTLAGRLRDRAEAERHITGARDAASAITEDVTDSGRMFGPQNTAVHVAATLADLGRYRESADTADELKRTKLSLPPTRVMNLFVDDSRTRLALKDRDGALMSLRLAFEAAPQKAKVHPTSQEVLRVLVELHRRSNPDLRKLANTMGLSF
ncbi:hypothetical protein GCM10022243_52920 [Saccharothrix violaceirubra]